MIVEREVLLSALKLTRDGTSTTLKAISKDSRIPIQTVHEASQMLEREGLITMRGDDVGMTSEQRVAAAVKAVKMGADLERACAFLTWAEFEDISGLAFEANGFSLRRHLIFKWSGRRWEVDIVAYRGEIIVSVDCKHWRRNWRRSSIRRIVEAHVERTKALSEVLPTLGLNLNLKGRLTVVPVVLSLIQGPLKFYMDVPVVPILQLRDFIGEMVLHIGSMRHFTIESKVLYGDG